MYPEVKEVVLAYLERTGFYNWDIRNTEYLFSKRCLKKESLYRLKISNISSTALVDQVKAYIAPLTPIGADVTIVGATEVSIDIRAKLTLHTGGDLTEAISQIRDNVTNYLKSLAFTDLIVRYAKIGDCILNAEPVLDYEL